MVDDTFYKYLCEFDTENVRWFRNVFGISLECLPTRVCSSKVIWNTLNCHPDGYKQVDFNCIKAKAFMETFSEYFKWKLHKAVDQRT